MSYPHEGLTRDYLETIAEPLNGQFVEKIAEKSADKQAAVIVPIFEKFNDHVYNTAVIIDDGRVKGGYRKIHLFDAYDYRESDLFHPGSNPVIFNIGAFTIGVVICYDIRFPELTKNEALSGARAIVVPAGWFRGPLKEEQWQTLLMARAQETTSYVIGVGNANETFVGRSTVVDPLGVKVLDLGSGDRTGCYRIDDNEVTEARKKLPVLKQSNNLLNLKCQQL